MDQLKCHFVPMNSITPSSQTQKKGSPLVILTAHEMNLVGSQNNNRINASNKTHEREFKLNPVLQHWQQLDDWYWSIQFCEKLNLISHFHYFHKIKQYKRQVYLPFNHLQFPLRYLETQKMKKIEPLFNTFMHIF